MRTLLMIMNPRRITECTYSLRMLTGVDIAWLTGFTEVQLVDVIAGVINSSDYDRYSLISDDTVVAQHALDCVLDTHTKNPEAAVQGWVNMCATFPRISGVMTEPLRTAQPTSADDYTWLDVADVTAHTEPFPATFGGLVLHTMTKAMWHTYPFSCYAGANDPGWGSDYHMCHRLFTAGETLLIDPRADIHHAKERWDTPDTDDRKKLYIGAEYQSVRIQPAASAV